MKGFNLLSFAMCFLITLSLFGRCVSFGETICTETRKSILFIYLRLRYISTIMVINRNKYLYYFEKSSVILKKLP